MPNHCENRLSFYVADQNRAEEVLDKIGKKDENGNFEIDFDILIPMPAILRRTRSGFRTFETEDGEVKVSVWTYDGPADNHARDSERPLTAEEMEQVRATGSGSWYDWSVQCWGTKWNAYDQNNDVDEEGGRFTFNTAWGPPDKWIAKLRETFPDVTFHGVYVIEFDEAAGML